MTIPRVRGLSYKIARLSGLPVSRRLELIGGACSFVNQSRVPNMLDVPMVERTDDFYEVTYVASLLEFSKACSIILLQAARSPVMLFPGHIGNRR